VSVCERQFFTIQTANVPYGHRLVEHRPQLGVSLPTRNRSQIRALPIPRQFDVVNNWKFPFQFRKSVHYSAVSEILTRKLYISNLIFTNYFSYLYIYTYYYWWQFISYTIFICGAQKMRLSKLYIAKCHVWT
jgi:hypothetical protein